MKHIALILIILAIPFVVFSQDDIQDVNNIVPPSPTSQSFHKYGNTNVSLYTGTPNIEIPIYTIKMKNLTLPITLNYSDGNGVRVNECATWVGLGWTLNTGGSITRTIQDLPDDYRDVGYYYKPYPIHDPVNGLTDDANDMHYRLWDGDPDVFRYSFSGNSGSFFIKKNTEGGGVLMKPIQNIIVDPVWNNTNNCRLDAFTITNANGNIYTFSEKEIEAALSLYGNFMAPFEQIPTSWYIKKITNNNLTEEISFDYKIISPGIYEEYSPYLENNFYTEVKRQKKSIKLPIIEAITFTDGIIEFIFEEDITKRNDKQDTYLKKILVKNNDGRIIKEFTFFYSYFASDGIIPLENNISGVHSSMRLKLDSIVETGKPAYVFTYNESIYLPDRYSHSVDHWGFFNGKDNNSFFHNYRIAWYLGGGSYNNLIMREYGDADRSSDENFSQSLILTKIQYPTGGATVFEYEQNNGRVENNEFFKEYIDPPENYNFLVDYPNQQQPDPFIYVITSSFAKVVVNGNNPGYDDPPGTICSKKVVFSAGGNEFRVFLNSSNDYQASIFLPNNRYNVEWNYYIEEGEEPGGQCENNDILDHEISLWWKNENITPTKYVGGVRIKSITNLTSQQTHTSIYSYIDDDGLSSGRLPSLPYYGHFIALEASNSPITVKSFKPELYSSTLLSQTKGNVVGYRKVTEKKVIDDEPIGKAEYTYTTSDDYPDLAGATPPWTEFPPDEEIPEYFYDIDNDFYIKPHPNEQTDSHDIQRGLLLSKTDYKISDEAYYPVKMIVNKYHCYTLGTQEKTTPFIYLDHITGHVKDGFIPEDDEGTTGNWWCYYFHEYKIYSNYQFKLSEKTTNYFESGNVMTETIYNYDIYDENEENPLYSPTRITTTLSDGSKKHIDFIYPRDMEQIVGFEPEEIIATEELFAKNIIVPIQITVTKDDVVLEKKRSNYNVITEGLFPVSTEKSYGDALLQEEVFYKYDSKGNILQYYKFNDVKTTIIWGYNDTYPIAKIVGIAYDDLTNQQKSKILELDNTEWTYSNRVQLEILNTQIRDLLPDGVMVSTYSYIPLVGAESETGPNGQTIFYEYDSFGKLEIIRDQNGDIIKRIEYHYKNEQQ